MELVLKEDDVRGPNNAFSRFRLQRIEIYLFFRLRGFNRSIRRQRAGGASVLGAVRPVELLSLRNVCASFLHPLLRHADFDVCCARARRQSVVRLECECNIKVLVQNHQICLAEDHFGQRHA